MGRYPDTVEGNIAIMKYRFSFSKPDPGSIGISTFLTVSTQGEISGVGPAPSKPICGVRRGSFAQNWAPMARETFRQRDIENRTPSDQSKSAFRGNGGRVAALGANGYTTRPICVVTIGILLLRGLAVSLPVLSFGPILGWDVATP